MEAHVLTLNDFSKPLVLDAGDAAYLKMSIHKKFLINIVYLLMTPPGRYPSHPTMGVGIRERYRYNNGTDFLLQLQGDIKSQMEQFLPELTVIDISLNVKNHILGILIDTSKGSYVLAYDSTKETMEASATYVLGDL